MDRDELRKICKEKDVYIYQIAHQMNVSEPTLIRWMRYPVTGELEKRIKDAIEIIVSARTAAEGVSK